MAQTTCPSTKAIKIKFFQSEIFCRRLNKEQGIVSSKFLRLSPCSKIFSPFFLLPHHPLRRTSSMCLDPSPYCLPDGWCNEAGEGSIRVTPHGGCFNASPHFATFSFYARSLLSLVRQTDVGWKMEEKTHKSEQRLERRKRRMERTLHRTKCAMVFFRATSMWHMPHVFVQVGNIVHPTWHERSWLHACNDLYV